jgi:hypothetical protein
MSPAKAQQTASSLAKSIPTNISADKAKALAQDIKDADNTAELASIIKSSTSTGKDAKVNKQVAKPSGYSELTVQQREDWNKYLKYLSDRDLAGSPSLDKGSPETEGMKKFKEYLAANPESSLNNFSSPENLIKSIQYEMKVLRGDPNYEENEEDDAYLGGAEHFGLEDVQLKAMQALLRKTRTPWAKIKTSDSDGNPGQYTTQEYYPLFGKSADYKRVSPGVYTTLVKVHKKTNIGSDKNNTGTDISKMVK